MVVVLLKSDKIRVIILIKSSQMRKVQSYQEPSPQIDLRKSGLSGSTEFQKSMRLSAEIDMFGLKNGQRPQPLFQLKQNINTPKQLFGMPKPLPSDKEVVRSLNANQGQKKSFKVMPKYVQSPATSRYSSNVGEELHQHRPSFAQLRKSQPEDVQSFLFTRHLNKVEREPLETKTSYKMSFGYRSNKGYNKKAQKINQDSYIINLNLGEKEVNFFGVCDGHGPFGHHVSGFLKNHLTEANKAINCKGRMKEQISGALKSASEKLGESGIDLTYSGSTLVGCYVCNDRIYCANVGDSRAIIGSKTEDESWSVWQISTDHKPSLKSEADRILKKGGRVEAVKNKSGKPIGPLRVWLKSEDRPGLAMTRSFGDRVAAQVGVHSQPQIIEHFLSDSDRIVVVASDGVWEFISNEDIINKLIPFYQKRQLEEACTFLQSYARAEWVSNNGGEIDDISFILIFLFHN